MSVEIICSATASPDGQHAPYVLTDACMPAFAAGFCRYCQCLVLVLEQPGTSDTSLVDVVTNIEQALTDNPMPIKPTPITPKPLQ